MAPTGILAGGLAVDLLKYDRAEGAMTVKTVAIQESTIALTGAKALRTAEAKEAHQRGQAVVGNAGHADGNRFCWAH